jgi:hypothetical protein
MNKTVKHLLFLLVISSSVACNSRKQHDQENSLIIHQVLSKIISTEGLFPVYPPPPPPYELLKGGEVIQDTIAKMRYNNLLSKIDTNKNVISVSDTTEVPIDSSQIINIIESDSTLGNYLEALKAFKAETKIRVAICFDSLSKIGKFSIIKYSDLLKQIRSDEPTYEFYYFGNFIFSKVYLNREQNYGFIIFTEKCGFDCDTRYLLFLEKKDGWKIIRHEVLSIH